MIQDILLPEKIGSYYLFGKRVIGIEVTKTHVYATVVYLNGKSAVIEQSLETAIEPHNNDSPAVRIGNALKKILHLAGKYHEIHFSLSSTQVIFKTLHLPFTDVDKIQKVIDFEVESLLPFSIADAVIDFIVTKANPELNTAEVLVAAVQKQYIAQQLELFSQIDVTPDVLGIDVFDLYGLYMQTAHEHKGNSVLIEVNTDATKIIFITDGQLRFVRILPLNLDFTKKANNEHMYSKPQTEESLQETSAMNEPFAQAKSLSDGILFTLQSFTAQAHIGNESPNILILGAGATVQGFLPWLQQKLNMPCELFNPMLITKQPHIKIKSGLQIPPTNAISTAAALPSPITTHVNLRQKEFAPNTEKLLLKQLICAALLLVTIFSALLTYSYLQKRALRNELAASRAEATDVLSQHFPNIESGQIDDMLDEAETENKKDEQTWFAFKRSARNSLLNLLLELTRLNREGLGLIVDKITIDQERNVMMLKAQVKDHDALVRLENELKQSNLFSYIQPQNDINFTMELRLKTDREGNQ